MIKITSTNHLLMNAILYCGIFTHMHLYSQQPPQGSASIDDAALNGNLREVQRIVVVDREAVNRKLVLNGTPLHLASMKGHLPVVQFLVEHGAQIDARDFEGMTPLFRAGKGGHLAVVTFLMGHGANLNATSMKGQTLLHHLCTKKNKLEVLTFLIQNGADINRINRRSGNSPLYEAAKKGNLDVVKLLIDNGAAVNTGRMFPLIVAVDRGHLEIVQCLLQNDAEIEAETIWKHNALSLALRNEHYHIAQCLIERYAIMGGLAEEVNRLWPELLTQRRDRLSMILRSTPLPTALQQLLIKFVIDK